MASVSPFSGSVIIIRENQDGFHVEVYHWDDLPDGTPIPPRGPITGVLAGGQMGILAGPTVPYSFHTTRQATTKADLIAKFTTYVNAKFPDSN